MSNRVRRKLSKKIEAFNRSGQAEEFQEDVCRQLMMLKQNKYIDFDDIVCSINTESVYTYKDFHKRLRVSMHKTCIHDYEEEIMIPFKDRNGFDLETLLLAARSKIRGKSQIERFVHEKV
jgi:hypothetical protein